MLYHTRIDLPNLFSGEGPFFFSGLTAGPTYQPSVRHSNPDTPLFKTTTVMTTAVSKFNCEWCFRSEPWQVGWVTYVVLFISAISLIKILLDHHAISINPPHSDHLPMITILFFSLVRHLQYPVRLPIKTTLNALAVSWCQKTGVLCLWMLLKGKLPLSIITTRILSTCSKINLS